MGRESLRDARAVGGGDAIVRFAGVQKTYDGAALVVRDLNLDIARGEFLTLLGPSGSGKTTTLMMLAGFEAATRGQILIDGADVTRVPPHKRDLGMVFQNYALFPHMTVAENLAFPLEVRKVGRSEIEAKVARALDMVRLGALGGRRPSQLSGGQQQRVALARALVFEPKLVLMDEPLGALDKQLREHMQYEIKHIHERLGVTFVYVTHDQSEALTMSDRIAIFDGGIIQQLGSPTEIYEAPANAFVAQFIGENNKLTGQIRKLDAGTAVVELESGEILRASPGSIGGIGSATVVSLRPERVRVGAGLEADNVFPARVQEAIYHGDHVRLRLEALGRTDFIVKVPAAEAAGIPSAGSPVSIAWSARDCRALEGRAA